MDHPAALTISAFARLVGLAPSALRFYDDCGVLKPARVDGTTGYRYYRPDQQQRALLLRDLRTSALPLAEVAAVLDGPPERARELLEAHQRRIRQEAEAAGSALDRVLQGLAGNSVRVSGLALAGAIRQVVPAASDRDFAVLGGVLIELTEGELRVVATDRYRLAVRVLRPDAGSGTGSLLVPAAELVALGRRVARLPEVDIDFDRRRIDITTVSTIDGEYPAYREMLGGLAPPRHRIVVDRVVLREVLGTEPVRLRVNRDEIGVGGTTIPALCEETPLAPAFDPAVLGPALDASVGPEVLLELVDELRPAVLRSADDGSFTTLVMPVEIPGDAR
jgi:DNA-binding transcriptional MerR regulator